MWENKGALQVFVAEILCLFFFFNNNILYDCHYRTMLAYDVVATDM